MKNKRSRGCNYTPTEKQMLLEIITKHKDIIESKETNAVSAMKKRETWEEITKQHNAVATTGHRTWFQLRHLYENIKQRAKKNGLPENVFFSKQQYKREKDDVPYITYYHDETLSTETYNPTIPSVSLTVHPVKNSENEEESKEEDEEECVGSIKKQYFKLLLRNAKIKNQYLINKNKMEYSKYKLEMEILKLRLRKLQGKIK